MSAGRLRQVSKMPRSIVRPQMQEALSSACTGFHESALRSWHILEEVKRYLRLNVPPSVVLELIEVMEDGEEATS